MTKDKIIAIQSAWLNRISDAADNWGVILSTEQLTLNIEIAMAAFIVENDLTPENIEAYIERRVSEFEKRAEETSSRLAPKRGRRHRRQTPDRP